MSSDCGLSELLIVYHFILFMMFVVLVLFEVMLTYYLKYIYQGLYSSFRETRKSLARELNSLQERLDSIKAKRPQQQMQEFFASKPVEDTPMDAQNGENVQDQQAVPAEGSSESNSHASYGTLEECLDQSCIKDGINSLPADDGGSESQSPMDPTSNEGTNLTVLPNGVVDQDVREVVTVDTCDSASNLSEADKMAVEHEPKSAVDDIPIEFEKFDMTICEELPVGVVDEDTIDISTGKDKQNENGRAETMDRSLPVMVENEMIEPVGLLDEGAVTSEFEKHDETETSQEVLPAEGVECNAESSPTYDDIAKETQLEQQQQQLEALLDIEDEGIGNDTKVLSPITQVKGVEPENGDECLEINKNIQPGPVETVITTQEDVPSNDLHREEKVTQGETQVEGHDLVTKCIETLAKEEAELSAASPASKELPDGGSNTKLLEENDKLRKMLEKLLEAGNDQLNVISDLTGRVKDLEKKLVRSKRVRTKRYRPATSKIRSNNPLQHRLIGVAM